MSVTEYVVVTSTILPTVPPLEYAVNALLLMPDNSKVLVVLFATVNSKLFTSTIPTTDLINTLSPSLKPCEAAVTTAGFA